MWSWDITYLPTSMRGVWLYLYLFVDVWSRKVVAWDVADREDAQIAAELVSRACLRERISKGRRQRLILHADNGNAIAEGFREAIAGRYAGERAPLFACQASNCFSQFSFRKSACRRR